MFLVVTSVDLQNLVKLQNLVRSVVLTSVYLCFYMKLYTSVFIFLKENK